MTLKTYKATGRGQAPNGAIIEEGTVFSADFSAVEREEPITRNGKVIRAGAIKRDADGNPKRKAGPAPSWAEEVKEARAPRAPKADD